MSLHEESVAYRAKAQQMLGDKFHVLTDGIDRLRGSGTIGRAVAVGSVAPPFTLPDAYGQPVSLGELTGRGPVLLTFYRGEWCPFCNFQLHAWQELMPQVQELGATLVAVSPEKPDFGVIVTDKHRLTFPVLSDRGNAVAREYGLVFEMDPELKGMSQNAFKLDLAARNGDDSWQLPVPGTFVIDTAGVVRYAHADPDYMVGRADPQEVLSVLRRVRSPAHA